MQAYNWEEMPGHEQEGRVRQVVAAERITVLRQIIPPGPDSLEFTAILRNRSPSCSEAGHASPAFKGTEISPNVVLQATQMRLAENR